MEKANSSTLTGTEECMPDWKEIMDALGTEDLFIFQSYTHRPRAGGVNGGSRDMSNSVNHIVEALGDPNVSRIGMCGKDDTVIDNLFKIIIRRIELDDLFDMIVMELVRQKSRLIEIQRYIACQLGLRNQQQQQKKRRMLCFFNREKKKNELQQQLKCRRLGFCDRKKKEAINENAKQLSDRIRAQPKILFILRNLHTTLDLAKLGIPLDDDRIGCKLILTSESKDILSEMSVHRTVTDWDSF